MSLYEQHKDFSDCITVNGTSVCQLDTIQITLFLNSDFFADTLSPSSQQAQNGITPYILAVHQHCSDKVAPGPVETPQSDSTRFLGGNTLKVSAATTVPP